MASHGEFLHRRHLLSQGVSAPVRLLCTNVRGNALGAEAQAARFADRPSRPSGDEASARPVATMSFADRRGQPVALRAPHARALSNAHDDVHLPALHVLDAAPLALGPLHG
eukprot:5955700-Lingulodinium_polyedra.AAC.1